VVYDSSVLQARILQQLEKNNGYLFLVTVSKPVRIVMLEARQLTKYYGAVRAVTDISFYVQPGEILGCLGPNGSGKSTTVKMLTGLLVPTHGEVYFAGAPIKEDLAGYKRRLGYVPEEPNLYPYLSGFEYLQLVGTLRGISPQSLEEKTDALLDLFELHAQRHSPLGAYSKGMRQKILIIAALLHDPDVLVFDEPLSGLDVSSALVFRNLMQTLARVGKTILYSSHVLEAVEKICSRVVIIYRGQVVAHNSIERLRQIMAVPSLEQVFSELVRQPDPEQVARDISETMKM
jgi:ABC-2 type transport system ATP-binding protein